MASGNEERFQDMNVKAEAIVAGVAAGLKIGLTASEKSAFHGATPVVQGGLVTNTSGTLGNTNAAINAIITILQNKGLMATS